MIDSIAIIMASSIFVSGALVTPALSQPEPDALTRTSNYSWQHLFPLPVTTDGSCGAGIAICGSTNGTCCSRYGWCGSTSEHCQEGCQAGYSFNGTCGDDASISTKSSLPVSTDGSCGSGVATCGSNGPCCSTNGWCGSTSDYCGSGCQANYSFNGICSSISTSGNVSIVASAKKASPSLSTKKASPAASTKKASAAASTKKASVAASTTKAAPTASSTSAPLSVTVDGSCGAGIATCGSWGGCCSQYGWCGSSSTYCEGGCQAAYSFNGTCANVTRTLITDSPLPVSTDGSCGAGIAICGSNGHCCSKYGWCGSTSDYCGSGCQATFSYKGLCSA